MCNDCNSFTKNAEDEVNDILHKSNNVSMFYTQTWITKYAVIYVRETSGIHKDRISFGSNDMNNKTCCLKDQVNNFS